MGDVINPNSLNRFAFGQGEPIDAVDPSGHWINFVLGAVIGAGVDAGVQLYLNHGQWSQLDWTSIGISALAGLTGVGLSEVIDTSIVRLAAGKAAQLAVQTAIGAAAGATIGAGAAVVRNLFEDQCHQTDVERAALFGGLAGAGGAALGGAVKTVANSVAEAAEDGATASSADAARSALGKGADAVPGSQLTPDQIAALQQNLSDTAANVERAMNDESLPPQLRERMFRLGMQRIETIQKVLDSGTVPPAN